MQKSTRLLVIVCPAIKRSNDPCKKKVEKVESVDWQKSTGLVHIGPVSFELHERGTNDKHLNSPQRRLSIYWIKTRKKKIRNCVSFPSGKKKRRIKSRRQRRERTFIMNQSKGRKRDKRARRDEIKIEKNSFSDDIMWTRFLSFESTQQKQIPNRMQSSKNKRKKQIPKCNKWYYISALYVLLLLLLGWKTCCFIRASLSGDCCFFPPVPCAVLLVRWHRVTVASTLTWFIPKRRYVWWLLSIPVRSSHIYNPQLWTPPSHTSLFSLYSRCRPSCFFIINKKENGSKKIKEKF